MSDLLAGSSGPDSKLSNKAVNQPRRGSNASPRLQKGASKGEADAEGLKKQPGQQSKANPDSKIEDWWAQFETSVWDQAEADGAKPPGAPPKPTSASAPAAEANKAQGATEPAPVRRDSTANGSPRRTGSIFGFGSPRNSTRSPRASRSPRAARTYFGFGSKNKGGENEDQNGAPATGAAEQTTTQGGASGERRSWISGIKKSIRSMSPRARSPRKGPNGGSFKDEPQPQPPASKSGQKPPAPPAPQTTPSSAPAPAPPAPTPVAAPANVQEPEPPKPVAPTTEAKYLRPHLRVGDALNGRYEIMHDISTGSFGHVIACKDIKQNGRTVAVKVQDRVEAKYHKDFKIEIDILEVVSKRPGRPESIVEMFEYFEHLGRWCIAFETLGPSLYEFQKAHQFRPYPLSAVRDIIRQSIEALAYVHSLELVHTDIKPENICLVSGEARKPGAPASTKIRLIDFGTAEWCAKDGHRNALVSTRQYRAPEVVMGLGWNHVADLWAIGCVVIEMLAGRQIFPTHGDLEQLAMVERVSGAIPQFMISQAPSDVREMFDNRGRVKSELVAPDRQSRVSRLMLLPNMFPDERDKNLLKLLLYLLTINPRARIPAKQALMNPFFQEGSSKQS